MSVITVFSGDYCSAEPIVGEIVSSTGYRLLTDDHLVSAAAHKADGDLEKIRRAFDAKTSVFNKFTHEKERSIAYLKMAIAEAMADDNLLISGFSAAIVPPTISHVLRVCLIADMKFRVELAAAELDVSEKEAVRSIHKADESRAVWIDALNPGKGPWDADLYDLVIPVDKTSVEQASALIQAYAFKSIVQPTEASRQALADFQLAAAVEVALTREGHQVRVSAQNGQVKLTINRHVLMLSRLEEELKSIVSPIPGVRSVETQLGKEYYQATIYRKHDFKAPSKVLLVDDEREFVQTLSERLQMRSMGAAVAYDGQSALDLVREDDPEVIIIDLKMPGIDGLEVLKTVKATRPEIEVIVLTGHGADRDKALCMELGAFAYLQKPVDIEELSETLNRAYAKIRKNKKT
jgi:CheY-like chemotaxis protein